MRSAPVPERSEPRAGAAAKGKSILTDQFFVKETIRIEETESGSRLDLLLASRLKGSSRSQIQKAIKDGRILLNGNTITPHIAVRPGDVITLETPAAEGKKASELTPRPDIELEIVHEDADVAVVNKPSGLLVHPSVRHENDTLANALIARYPEIAGVGESWERPGIMHRLDKDASGLLVVARNEKAYASLKRQFQRHTIKKVYQVLVHGRPPKDAGTIDLAIGRAGGGTHMAARPRPQAGDKSAVTHYSVDAVYAGAALLTVWTETGRTHQIRAHFKALGCPVAGDLLYKVKRVPFLPAPRLFLHAKTLGFTHPATRKKMEFQAPLPPDLRETLAKLK